MLRELFTIAVIVIDIIVISDVVRKLRSDVAKFLWVVCVLALPGIGAGFWYYIQYVIPKQRRIEKQRRREMKQEKAGNRE